MDTFLVSGCGVSAICSSRESVIYWCLEMINRGGFPTVKRWASNG